MNKHEEIPEILLNKVYAHTYGSAQVHKANGINVTKPQYTQRSLHEELRVLCENFTKNLKGDMYGLSV